mmetsp:Transcript_7723/g.12732  ORF Transcript_7723/g.12732 Transcript_7723/m.12732 type:complete len:101 (+) Transcript_7723:985-1287(+)
MIRRRLTEESHWKVCPNERHESKSCSTLSLPVVIFSAALPYLQIPSLDQDDIEGNGSKEEEVVSMEDVDNMNNLAMDHFINSAVTACIKFGASCISSCVV